ncbi:MAG: TPM domain-containing protein [Roseiflexus sp.]|nr:TPM domain-containing protein [Roseiflexus sp.]MCS7290508.1 TPM domain-containing protein [Roseiflexus sp.]MDW8232285.1 hypothetical protein [Roseiflexaceae bacterium]
MIAHRTWHLRVILALIATLLLTGCAAQASSPGSLIIIDETERLNQARVAQAAAPLLQRGATVAIFIVKRGDNNGQDMTIHLANAGLRGYDRIVPNALAIYVSYEPRYSELRAGSNWSNALSQDVLHTIRTEALNPALRNGNVTDGVVETLKRFDSTLVWHSILRPRLSDVLLITLIIIGIASLVIAVRYIFFRGPEPSYYTSLQRSDSSRDSWSGASSGSSSWSGSDSSGWSGSDSSSGGWSDGSSSSGGSW